jgi:DNA-binding XRE family transcriptional regulator
MAKDKKIKFQRWEDLKHKGTPAQRAVVDKAAVAELDRMGYAALRKARSLTQAELAANLSISQASVAALESRTDLHLSTLAKYVRAMGGELQMRAVFPEATFNLVPPIPAKPAPKRAVRRKAA